MVFVWASSDDGVEMPLVISDSGAASKRQVTTSKRPEKSLTTPLPKKGGRNHHGKITVRGRGGGHKRRYRIIDFKRRKLEVPSKVASVEYDPNRSARIAPVARLRAEGRIRTDVAAPGAIRQ